MDTQSNLPKPELPKPILNNGESVGDNSGTEHFGSFSPELYVQPMPSEQINQANDAVAQLVSSLPADQPTQQSDDNTATSSSGSPVIADDSDVIEKEWVDKAKDIVARTQGDPHAKSNQLTFLKKDYMQKRYGKMIKTPNDNSVTV